MPENGTTQRGPHPSAKLIAREVREIYGLKGRGITQAYVAFLYDVSPTAIGEIWRGRSWRWLKLVNHKARHAREKHDPEQGSDHEHTPGAE